MTLERVFIVKGDVLVHLESHNIGLIESVGNVDAILANVRRWVQTWRQFSHIHKLVLKLACEAASHFLIEALGSFSLHNMPSMATAHLQYPNTSTISVCCSLRLVV